MKRVYFYLALLLVLSLAIPAFADNTTTGNGAPSGAHYNLNIIGVPQDKTADMTGDNGHRIFVKLQGNTKIMLHQAGEDEDYKVLDANGTDGSAAFQLPAADLDDDGITSYSVYLRFLGNPNGTAMVTTCGNYPGTEQEAECVTQMYELTMRTRGKGGNKFTNVSKELLYVYADLDGVGGVERYPLFDDALEGYFWDYDNHGLKLAQFRFYEMSTDVN